MAVGFQGAVRYKCIVGVKGIRFLLRYTMKNQKDMISIPSAVVRNNIEGVATSIRSRSVKKIPWWKSSH